MRSVAVLFFIVGSCLGSLEEFRKFKSTYNKQYTSLEETKRYRVFLTNLEKIRKHNAKRSNTWTMKVTEFADLTAEEFAATLTGYKSAPMSGHTGERKIYSQELPESVDWRDKGVISDVKNQGSCGSCWAFATVAQIESYAAINSNTTALHLSDQEVTSCSPNTMHCGGRGGCQGSIPQLGFNYIQLFGLTTAKEYPYWSGVTTITGRCKYDLERRAPVVGMTGYNTIPPNDLEATLQHIANVGPLSIAAAASAWQFYGSGVFNSCDYEDNITLNHAVQLVGYGTDPEKGPYWLVRNSWGSAWGERGYIRLQREDELNCGIDSRPADGTACENGPGMDQQTVCGMCGLLFDSSYPLGAHML